MLPAASKPSRFFSLTCASRAYGVMFRPILLGRMQELMPDLQDQPSAVEVTAEPETNTLIVPRPLLCKMSQEARRLDRSSYAGRRTFRTQWPDPWLLTLKKLHATFVGCSNVRRSQSPGDDLKSCFRNKRHQKKSEPKTLPRGISANPISGLVA